VLEAQRAGEVGERTLDCWRGEREACEGQLQRRRWREGGEASNDAGEGEANGGAREGERWRADC
jgi:hypothetical protein